MRAFSGYLPSNQLLALWDRIGAFHSLEILLGRRSSSIEREREREREEIEFVSSRCSFGRVNIYLSQG